MLAWPPIAAMYLLMISSAGVGVGRGVGEPCGCAAGLPGAPAPAGVPAGRACPCPPPAGGVGRGSVMRHCGVFRPRWQVLHWTSTLPLKKVLFVSRTILIISRAVFFSAFASEA